MLKRMLVVVEVVFVFLAGTFGARFLLKALHITGSKEAIRSGNFDAAAVAIPMSIRWAIVIGLAFLVGWLVARHRPRDYGFTLAGRSLTSHLGIGVVVYALGYTPVLLLMMARRYFHLEGGPAVWNQIDAATWDLNFWLWMLASSMVLPVLVEETFFRGYVQTRWMTAFRPMTTVVFIAVVFILIHTQYLDGSIIGTAMIVSGFWWAILLGVARWRTGSLIAPMLAHALSNTPLRPAVQIAMLFVLLAVLLVASKQARALRLGFGQ